MTRHEKINLAFCTALALVLILPIICAPVMQ